MTDETETQTEVETTTKEAVSRRKWRFDDKARSVLMTEPTGAQSTYPLASLPTASLDYIAQLGLILFCGRAESPDVAYDELAAGTLPKTRGEAAPKVTSHWKAAVALAVQDFAKKSGVPVSSDDAMTRVKAMERKDFDKLKSDPAVIKHWRKLSGVEAVSIATLLAA